MSILKSLTLTPAINKNAGNPRRQKLLNRLDVQLKMAEALINNSSYVPTKEKFKLDDATGLKNRVLVQKNVAKWWAKIDNIYYFSVRYGNKPLELSKGNFSIQVGEESDLVPTIKKVIEAVASGELDTLLENVTTNLSKKK
jgi:TRAP-type mannitol/chloroaromatic compound transport system substrate-binding protein